MPGLLDIVPSAKTVPVNGADVSIPGVSAKGIAYLFNRFPEVRAMFAGKAEEFTAESLMTLVPDAIAAVIAAGTGNPSSAEAEAIASNLPAEAQCDLLEAIIEVTMPKGIGPFVERLGRLMDGVRAESMNLPGTKSPSPSKL